MVLILSGSSEQPDFEMPASKQQRDERKDMHADGGRKDALSNASPNLISDALWEKVAPLIPVRRRPNGKRYLRREGGGRKPKDTRLVFEAIVYVLSMRCAWKALPESRYGSASAIHARFLEWRRAGLFDAIWTAGLAEHEDLSGISWRFEKVEDVSTETLPSDAIAAKEGFASQEAGEKLAEKTERRAWTPVIARRRSRRLSHPATYRSPDTQDRGTAMDRA